MTPLIGKPFQGSYPITFAFGEAPDWYTKVYHYPHNGVDYGLPLGKPVLACEAGVVTYADSTPDSNGMGINITHNKGMSQYWHLKTILKQIGDIVAKGDLIGSSGDNGFATGPHLHFGYYLPEASPVGMHGWTDPVRLIESAGDVPEYHAPVQKWYIVGLGDTLWKIALKYYGNGYYWRRIYTANQDIIKDPALIFPFQKLLIP